MKLKATCSLEEKLLGLINKLDTILKSRDITLPSNVHIVKVMFFPVDMCSYDSWTIKKAAVQSLSPVLLFATPWTATLQDFLSITDSQSLLRLTSIESVMSSNHLILRCPFLLPPYSYINFTVVLKAEINMETHQLPTHQFCCCVSV